MDNHLLPQGPCISDWVYVGEVDSKPPVVKSTELYEHISLLGRGAFCEVHLGKNVENQKLCVIKKLFCSSDSDFNSAVQEVNFLRNYRHPCIIDIYDAFIMLNPSRVLNIVMYYCESGTLASAISTAKSTNSPLNESLILTWMVQLSFALSFLHDNHIVHCNLKSSNILLTQGGELIKLTNFSHAINVNDNSKELITNDTNAPYYTAPEMIHRDSYSYSTDCWSLGIIIYELLALERPFKGSNATDLIESILNSEPAPLSTQCAEELKNICCKLLRKTPKERLTVKALLCDPYIFPKANSFPQQYHPAYLEDHIIQHHINQLEGQLGALNRYRRNIILGKSTSSFNQSTASLNSDKKESEIMKSIEWILLPIQKYINKFLSQGPFCALFAIGVVGGITGSLGGCLFKTIWSSILHAYSQEGGGFVTAASNMPGWERFVVSTVAGTLAALLVIVCHDFFTPSKQGPDYGEAIKEGDGRLHLIPSLLRSLLGVIIICGGFTIGREGAMVNFASVCASAVGQLLDLSPQKQRLIVACGAAGGFATAYMAPIAGGSFVAKLLLKKVENISELAAVLLAAILGKMATTAVFQQETFPLYKDVEVQSLQLQFPDLIFAVVIGGVCGIIGGIIITIFESVHGLADKYLPSLPVKIWIAGVVVGLLAVGRPQVWGNGYTTLQAILQADNPGQNNPSFLDITSGAYYEVFFLRLIAVIATTPFANLPGGVMTPTMTFGAMISYPFGIVMKEASYFPHHNAAVCMIAGMSALLATTTQSPVIASILVFELTDGYRCLGVSIPASVIAFLVSKNIKKKLLSCSPIVSAASPVKRASSAGSEALGLGRRYNSANKGMTYKTEVPTSSCNDIEDIEDIEKQQSNKIETDQNEIDSIEERKEEENSVINLSPKRPVEDFSYLHNADDNEEGFELTLSSKSMRHMSEPDAFVPTPRATSD